MTRAAPRPCRDDAEGARRAGVALLLVLWAVALLTALLGPYLEEALDQRRLWARAEGELAAWAAARAGVERAIAQLADDDPAADGLTDGWSRNDAAFKNVALAGPDAGGEASAGSNATAASYSVMGGGTPDGKTALFGVVDEDRKIDVMKSLPAVLEKCPGLTANALQAIQQIRSRFEQSQGGPTGSGGPGAASFVTVRSLLALKPITPEIFYGEDWNEDGVLQDNENDGDKSLPPDDADGILRHGINDALTVYTDGLVNLNTASVDVLQALTMVSKDLAVKILEARTKAGKPFTSTADVAQLLGLSPGDTQGLSEQAKVTSTVFRIVSRGEAPGGGRSVTIETIVKRDQGKITTLFYRED